MTVTLFQKRKGLKIYILRGNLSNCEMFHFDEEFHVKIESETEELATFIKCRQVYEMEKHDYQAECEYYLLIPDQMRWERVDDPENQKNTSAIN
ncbi:hypothetical protein [Peribacillus frigoritolerans]|uniref:hypothetical protein n=1 Tax=Peribacillus frigoritolerans TaxID=450367 RepID=UPI00301A895F